MTTTELKPAAHRVEILPRIWADVRRAVWFADEKILAVADLHWGYAASHRARGNLLPLWGDDDIAHRLDELVRLYQPDEMIWVGDVVHAAEGAGRAEQYLEGAAVSITVLAGNHDRRWRRAGAATAARGSYLFHHGDVPADVPAGAVEVVGHHHPAVAWSDGAGGSVRIPALVVTPRRLILPAFSPWAVGTDWTPRREPESTLWAIAPKRIFRMRAGARMESES